MLTDDDCRAIRDAWGMPALSFTCVRKMLAAINAMPDGPVWVVPREASETMCILGEKNTRVEWIYEAMTAAGAAEMGEG